MANKQRFRNIVTNDMLVQNDLVLEPQANFLMGGVQMVVPNKGIGKTFYVDPRSGSDDYPGTSPSSAKLTSQAAIDLCVDRRMDTIIRLNGTEVLTTPILFNKQGIMYICEDSGWNNWNKGERFAAYGPNDDYAAVISEPCLIQGLGFTTAGFIGAGSAIVYVDSTGFDGWTGSFFSILGCRFMGWGFAPQYALKLNGGVSGLIAGNHFDGTFYGFTEAGILLDQYDVDIIGNKFTGMGDGNYAIEVKAGTTPLDVIIASNYLVGASADGVGRKGIGAFLNTNATLAWGCLIADNHIPLSDDTAFSVNHADMITANYHLTGNHYIES